MAELWRLRPRRRFWWVLPQHSASLHVRITRGRRVAILCIARRCRRSARCVARDALVALAFAIAAAWVPPTAGADFDLVLARRSARRCCWPWRDRHSMELRASSDKTQERLARTAGAAVSACRSRVARRRGAAVAFANGKRDYPVWPGNLASSGANHCRADSLARPCSSPALVGGLAAVALALASLVDRVTGVKLIHLASHRLGGNVSAGNRLGSRLGRGVRLLVGGWCCTADC